MQAHGETTIASSRGARDEFQMDEGKWFLIWVGVWVIALAALLPALV